MYKNVYYFKESRSSIGILPTRAGVDRFPNAKRHAPLISGVQVSYFKIEPSRISECGYAEGTHHLDVFGNLIPVSVATQKPALASNISNNLMRQFAEQLEIDAMAFWDHLACAFDMDLPVYAERKATGGVQVNKAFLDGEVELATLVTNEGGTAKIVDRYGNLLDNNPPVEPHLQKVAAQTELTRRYLDGLYCMSISHLNMALPVFKRRALVL